MKPILLALILAACPAAAPARLPVHPPGLVSAADPRAAAAGVEILRAGGSAADAAVAMMLALNVVEPLHSGIGGGGYLVHHDARTGRFQGYDGRETAPAAADPHWFYTPEGTPLAHGHAVPGGRSVGVPGNLRLMALVHDAHGRLPWRALFAPAIRLARQGFAITPRLHDFLARYGDHEDDWARFHFYDAAGRPLPVGTVLRNPDQAALFERIAARGPDSFYVGPEARRIVATVNNAARNPSRMSLGDLATYQAKERPPVCGNYRGYRICGMGPSSAGGVAVLQIVKQLERFDMAGLGAGSPVAWHLFAESSRLAYADRDAYLADPDHEAVPVAGLTDPAYLAGRSALIAPDRAMATVAAGRPAGVPARAAGTPVPEHGTTDMAVVDGQGDVAEVTSTIEGVFGSGLSVDGTMLNNELTDFDIVPDKDGVPVANRVEGGKRPRSSMSPTIVYAPDGTVRLAIGAAGGATIIAQVAKAIVAVIDWHRSAADAIALPLLFAPGRTGIVEQGTALEAMVPALRALGEDVRVAPLGLKANAIERVDGHWRGAADPRSEGVAMSETGEVTRPRDARALGAPSE
jgi:gamma-glutamyltranspeptidase/glutathione hydrolase